MENALLIDPGSSENCRLIDGPGIPDICNVQAKVGPLCGTTLYETLPVKSSPQ